MKLIKDKCQVLLWEAEQPCNSTGWGSSSGENVLQVCVGSEQDMSPSAPWQQGQPSSILACVNRGTARRSRVGVILPSAQPLLNPIETPHLVLDPQYRKDLDKLRRARGGH